MQPGFDEKEGGAGGGAEDTRGGAAEDVNGEGLDCGRGVEERREGCAQGFVEAETAAVEGHLVDVLCSEMSEI